jgi:hypothetical protein
MASSSFFLDLLNDFSGCWVLDHRYLGKFLLAEGIIIGRLCNFVGFHHVIILAFLFPPVIGFFKAITGSPHVSVVGDFLWVDRPTFGALVLFNSCDKWIIAILAFLCDVDHCVAVIAMDDPWFA